MEIVDLTINCKLKLVDKIIIKSTYIGDQWNDT